LIDFAKPELLTSCYPNKREYVVFPFPLGPQRQPGGLRIAQMSGQFSWYKVCAVWTVIY